MDNKYVGYLLLGVSVIMTGIIFMFKKALTSFVDASCTAAHGGDYCPMYDTITQQTYLALGLVGILVLVGVVLIFSKPSKEIIIKKVEQKKKKKIIPIAELKPEEKNILKMIQEHTVMFQSDLIEKTGLGKAKITRILDRLEGKNILERKRRGMTNIVVMKEH